MKNNFDDYADWEIMPIDEGNNINKVKELITGSTIWKASALQVNNWPKNKTNASVIDFGCGLGRNVEILKNKFEKVVGVDLPAMIELLKSSEMNSYDEVSSNFDYLLDKYNLTHVFESVVWQHIVWESGIVQKILKKITNSKSICSIYSVWNANVKHQENFISFLKENGWELESSGNLENDESLCHVLHKWYIFNKVIE